ncbi:uncharacterized protein BO96DRAFT_304846, partial [Aspergillus niger CBS 101883]|uniref:uncharacterized protein n=1 Tax=Aspergillus lacticoffeatus (strain CBS 101883) TaxID=1450533 RepID=UPI000D8021E4
LKVRWVRINKAARLSWGEEVVEELSDDRDVGVEGLVGGMEGNRMNGGSVSRGRRRDSVRERRKSGRAEEGGSGREALVTYSGGEDRAVVVEVEVRVRMMMVMGEEDGRRERRREGGRRGREERDGWGCRGAEWWFHCGNDKPDFSGAVSPGEKLKVSSDCLLTCPSPPALSVLYFTEKPPFYWLRRVTTASSYRPIRVFYSSR